MQSAESRKKPLTDKAIQAAKPGKKPYKLAGAKGDGLTLLVMPNGAKLWRFRYRFDGREQMLSMGKYPDTTLAMAREKRDDARRQLSRAEKVNPADVRREEKQGRQETFKAVAEEWLPKQNFAPKTLAKTRWTLDDLIYPHLGNKPVSSITGPQVLAVCRRLESRGKHETAHRTKQRISQVLRYAVATGRAERDVTADLRGALTPITVTHHASVKDPAEIGELLRAIDGFKGDHSTEAALRLAPLVFLRPMELRGAEWSEFDLESKEPSWRIPGHRMKRRRHSEPGLDHIVPLSKQAVKILKAVQKFTGHGKLVFPSLTDRNRPLSENALTSALRRMGFTGDQMTWHGFRSMASTRLNEMGFNRDWIERQLAHVEGNQVRDAYNAAEWLPARRKMMQKWADTLDQLKAAKRKGAK